MKPVIKTLAACMLAAVAGLAGAQGTFPSKPVRLIVPAAAGGTTDLLARALGQRLSTAWGQPVIVDNRPGANQIIGADAVAKSAPDGYTLLVSDVSTFAINPHLYKKLPYDSLRDFTPITTIGNASPVIAVSSNVDARSLRDLILLAKSKPDTLSYGSMGAGSYAHIATEEMKLLGGMNIQHVPYKGASPAIADLVAGNISMMLVNASGLLPYQKAGKVRIIAAATPKRLAQFPDLPTASEAGLPGFSANTWFGVVGPARMDKAVLAKLNRDMVKIIQSQEFREQALVANSVEPMTQSPAQFRDLIKSDLERWKGLVAASGAKLD